MLFKNASIYRLTKPLAHPLEELETLLATYAFKPCGETATSSTGFIPVVYGADDLVLELEGVVLVAIRTQSKIIPADAIREAVETKVAEIQARESRTVYSKERRQVKEDIVAAYTPDALTSSRRVYALIDTVRDLVIVNAASPSMAERILGALREALGSLPVVPLETVGDPVIGFTGWLAKGLPEGFKAGKACNLIDLEGGRVSVRDLDIRGDEVVQLIDEGFKPSRLELSVDMNSDPAASFVLDDHLRFRSIKFSDELLTGYQAELEDAGAIQSADMAIMSATFRHFVTRLGETLGGLVELS